MRYDQASPTLAAPRGFKYTKAIFQLFEIHREERFFNVNFRSTIAIKVLWLRASHHCHCWAAESAVESSDVCENFRSAKLQIDWLINVIFDLGAPMFAAVIKDGLGPQQEKKEWS